MWQIASQAIIAVLKQLGIAIVISALSEKFLKKLAIWALRKLVKYTSNELDDELLAEVEKALDKKSE